MVPRRASRAGQLVRARERRYATQFLPAFDPALCGAGAGGASKDGGGEAPLGSLRFRLTQPSMMWNGGMELRNLRCFMFKRPPE